MKKILLVFSALICSIAGVYSQTVDASPETQTICVGASANLTAVVTPGAPGTSAPTNSYSISSIAYAPDPLTAGTSVTLSDDSQTGLIPIGFTFCFYGNTYTNFIIGSNNWIGFQTGETSTWVTAPIPNTSGAIAPRNTIMGPWQDINPGAGGTVRYQLYGAPPFRRLSVSWNNVPMFSCTGQLYSSQIIIYESTNVIETHIFNKSLCATWNSGNAVHGLHNATGTAATVVTGRNNTAWIANNEGTRFTPNGTPSYVVNWYILPANTLVGTGLTISVTPPTSPQSYYAQVVDVNSCTAASTTSRDTVVVFSQQPSVDAGAYQQVCPGVVTPLNATSGTATSYSWSPAGSVSNPAISNPTTTPAATTTFTVTVADALGCTNSDTVTVALNTPAPTTTATPSAICTGGGSLLNATGGGTYSWSPAGSLSSTTVSNPTATPTGTTTYTVTVTAAGGCTASSTVTLTVNPLPTISAGADVAICTGQTTTLTGTGGVSYNWSPAGSLSGSTTANPTSSATTTTTYTVVATDGNGCSNQDDVTVTVNPLPTVDAGPNTTICPSASTTLNGSGASTYLWSPAGSLSNPAIANPVASPTSATTYTVVGTDVNGCSASDLVTISINPINVFTAGAATICQGASTTISAFGASNYLWSPAGTVSNPTVSSPVATPTATTTYTVVGTNGAGCNDTAFVTVTVTPSPAVDAGLATSMCLGSTTTLIGSGASSYSWSPAGSLTGAGTATPTSSATSTTTYTVTGTQSGCTATDVVTVTVNPLPSVDAGSTTSICPGNSTTLNGTGATGYSWSPAGSLSSSTVSNPTASPSSPTTYTLTGTDASGCSNTDTVTVFVSGLVISASSSASSVCNGDSVSLSSSGASSYSWSPATGLSSTTIANPVAGPSATTTYMVVGTQGACNDTAFLTITVNAIPAVNAGSTAVICSGSTTTLGATGATNYLWSPSTGLSSTTIAGPTSSTTTTTLYTVVGTDASGCSASDTVSVIVQSLPLASAGPAASICNGSSTTLSATGGVSYSWSPGTGLSSTSIASPTASPTGTTTYTVTATGSNGCTATSAVTVTVNPVPVAAAGADVTICAGGSTPLSASGGGTYSWSPGAGLSSTSSASPTATPAMTTTYTVSVSNGSCTSTDVVTVTVNSTMSMATPSSTPATCGNTPGDGTLTAGTISGGGAPYMYSINGGPNQSSSSFTGLSAGTYTVTVTDASGCTASNTVTVGSVNNVNASFSASPTSGPSPLTVNLSNSSTGASDYIWDFGDGTGSILTSPSTVYNADGSYVIMLIAYNSSLACADTMSITINVFDASMMTVPNVFTPNGDGNNDMFLIISEGIKTVEGTMYNRWGKKVGEWSGDPGTAGWDGKINGKAAEDGTYYYVLKATGMDDKEYEAHGYVQLLGSK